MQRSSGPAASAFTWMLALLFVVLIDVGVTRTALLWHHTAFENSRELSETVFGQCYRAARMIYAPDSATATHVAVLGNSRIAIPGYAAYVEPEIERLAPGSHVSLDNLGIFGAGLGDLEMLSRHLPALHPAGLIIALGTDDLLATEATDANPLANVPARLFNIGWRDGPLLAHDDAERVDRWARTVWPLYRFHEFARAVVADRIAPQADAGPVPPRFANTMALFERMHGDRAGQVEAAYRAWRGAPTLDRFVAYLQIGSGGHLDMVRKRARVRATVDANALTARLLDRILARAERYHWKAIVLVMPENPILAQDANEEYHHRDFSDRATALLGELAARRGATIVDARRWMPMEAFLDFDHLLPYLSGFQKPLAAEIVHAVEQ
jgi:hypothetical protein